MNGNSSTHSSGNARCTSRAQRQRKRHRHIAVAATCLLAVVSCVHASGVSGGGEFIDLSFSHVGPVGASEVLFGLSEASAAPSGLLLQECSLGDRGALDVVSSTLVSSPAGVGVLSLRHNHIGRVGSRSLLQHLRAAPDRLQTLVLDFNLIGDAGLQPLPALLKDSSNGRLESLSLRFCGISAAGCRSIASALIKAQVNASDRGIRHLSLAGNPLGDAGAKALAAALKQNVALEEMDLTRCEIGDDGAHHLAQALLSNTNLRHLSLSYNDIGAEGAAELAQVLRDGASGIQRLDLDHNHIADGGAFAFARALSAKQGRNPASRNAQQQQDAPPGVALGLAANGIGCEGCSALATALAYNCRLESLDLSGNPLFGAAPKAKKGATGTAKALLTKQATSVVSSLGKLYTQFVDETYMSAAAAQQEALSSSATAFGRALRRNARLRRLGLAHTSLDARAWRQLRRDLLASGALRWVDVSLNAGAPAAEVDEVLRVLADRRGAAVAEGSGDAEGEHGEGGVPRRGLKRANAQRHLDVGSGSSSDATEELTGSEAGAGEYSDSDDGSESGSDGESEGYDSEYDSEASEYDEEEYSDSEGDLSSDEPDAVVQAAATQGVGGGDGWYADDSMNKDDDTEDAADQSYW